MKLSVTQQSLAKALSIVSRAVSSRTTMPVLGNILLDASGSQLRLAATNREIAINCWIGAKVEDVGAITIPARLLAEFVNSLPPERIDLRLDERTQTLRLECARFTANMKGIDAFEFPELPTMEKLTTRPDGATAEWQPGTQVALDAAGLRKMIDQTTFAASADENRPTLTGVEVTLQPDAITMAATDGYRLSVRTATIEGGPEKNSIIVPAKSLNEVSKISVDAAESQPVQVLITPQRNQVMVAMVGGEKSAMQRVEMISELIDARFPDYRATIPKNYTTRTVVDTAALLKAVRLAILFARDNANIIRLHIGAADVRITAASGESGDNVSDLAATVEGPPLEIGMNARYIIDALSQFDTPQVALETTVDTRPMMIRPVGYTEFHHTIMPMHKPR